MKKKLFRLLLALVLCVGVFPATGSAATTYTDGELTYAVNNGEATVTDCVETVTHITIPASLGEYPVTGIGSRAFEDCRSLTGVTIPDSVTTIGDSAFKDCRSLTGVTIPDSVTTIGDSAFEYCSSLTGITIPDGVSRIDNCAFCYCSSLTNVIIPNRVTAIEYLTFSGCSSLTEIALPASLNSLGEDAFEGCSCLKTISLDPNNTSYCTDRAGVLFDIEKTELIVAPRDISSYVIPVTVKTIDQYAFEDCSSLTSIMIPDTLRRFQTQLCYIFRVIFK